jgi:hypothetical protein
MALERDFIKAAEDKNKRMVRIKLANSITIDPTLRTFKEMHEYAIIHVSDLFDTHKGILLTDEKEWTKDYYDKQQTELSFNFSRERLKLVCDMAQRLYSGRIKTINNARMKNKETVNDWIGDFVVIFGEIVEHIGKRIKDLGNKIKH